IADGIDNSDGASLTYVLADMPNGPGLEFDPGLEMARGVIVRADGENLALLTVPEGVTCTVVTDQIDCRLGDVEERVVIGLTGADVTANATWRRTGNSQVSLTFAKLPIRPQ